MNQESLRLGWRRWSFPCMRFCPEACSFRQVLHSGSLISRRWTVRQLLRIRPSLCEGSPHQAEPFQSLLLGHWSAAKPLFQRPAVSTGPACLSGPFLRQESTDFSPADSGAILVWTAIPASSTTLPALFAYSTSFVWPRTISFSAAGYITKHLR